MGGEPTYIVGGEPTYIVKTTTQLDGTHCA